MKPIHEFNDFLKEQIGNLSYFTRKNCLNFENFLKTCVTKGKCVTQGMSTVYYFLQKVWFLLAKTRIIFSTRF